MLNDNTIVLEDIKDIIKLNCLIIVTIQFKELAVSKCFNYFVHTKCFKKLIRFSCDIMFTVISDLVIFKNYIYKYMYN